MKKSPGPPIENTKHSTNLVTRGGGGVGGGEGNGDEPMRFGAFGFIHAVGGELGLRDGERDGIVFALDHFHRQHREAHLLRPRRHHLGRNMGVDMYP